MQRNIVGKKLIGMCFVIILLSIILPSTNHVSGAFTESKHSAICYSETYHNATIFVITNLYRITYYDEELIRLGNHRYPHLPGIFVIVDENGMQKFNMNGGWMGARIEIYDFDGIFRDGYLYVTLVGNCEKINIIPIR